jgi:hypothetical protein
MRHAAVLAAALLHCAPLGAQWLDGTACAAVQAPDSVEAAADVSAADAPALVRYACAGSGSSSAVAFQVALPAEWDVVAEDGVAEIRASRVRPAFLVLGEDLLPALEDDSAAWWARATELAEGRAPLDDEIAAFHRLVRDPGGARAAVTHGQLRGTELLRLTTFLSAAEEGTALLDSAAELRTLAGRPAGYRCEVYREDGRTWRRAVYATVHQARRYAVSFTAPEDDFQRLRPLWRRVLDSIDIEPGTAAAPSTAYASPSLPSTRRTASIPDPCEPT